MALHVLGVTEVNVLNCQEKNYPTQNFEKKKFFWIKKHQDDI